ncbi:hypothetical protein ACWDR2_31025 [Streptomyces sp. NPDC003631]|uniref:Uncharacterized protein n=2 Tax=Streptomyces TaxID=1883 RepID=A0ABP7KW26_9ACTN|nr:hypothetical protein [Streptomyces sp. WAC07094]
MGNFAAQLIKQVKCHHQVMTTPQLPPGWTIRRIREVSGDSEAQALSINRTVKYVRHPAAGMEDELLHPEFILGFGDLCLVKAVSEEDWLMGSLYPDGSVDCWGNYGALAQALRGL